MYRLIRSVCEKLSGSSFCVRFGNLPEGKSMKRRYRELSKVLHADKRGKDDLFHKLDIAKKALEAAVKEKCPRESKS